MNHGSIKNSTFFLDGQHKKYYTGKEQNISKLSRVPIILRITAIRLAHWCCGPISSLPPERLQSVKESVLHLLL